MKIRFLFFFFLKEKTKNIYKLVIYDIDLLFKHEEIMLNEGAAFLSHGRQFIIFCRLMNWNLG
jgi:hypothetical protein